MEEQRVQKFIALSGIASRRKAEELIEQGRVKVNDKQITIGDKCLPTDKIKVNNKLINFDTDDKKYIIINKSYGYITTKSDELGRKTVFDLLKPQDRKKNLFSVGRLDKDTTGLLILTNDGDFNQQIIHPSKKISKEYIVILDKELENQDKIEIQKGIELDNYKLKRTHIKQIGELTYLVKIFEGRKRQVRRMFEEFNYNIVKLTRIRIGNLDLKDTNLKHGEYEIVSKEFLLKKIF